MKKYQFIGKQPKSVQIDINRYVYFVPEQVYELDELRGNKRIKEMISNRELRVIKEVKKVIPEKKKNKGGNL